MDDKSEEQVLFASKQVSATAPRLLVTYTSSTTSLVPWYIWVAGIVIIAIIAFFVGWSVTRRRQQIIQQQVIIGGQPPEQKK
jgi:Na+/H+ antiporter NhaC